MCHRQNSWSCQEQESHLHMRGGARAPRFLHASPGIFHPPCHSAPSWEEAAWVSVWALLWSVSQAYFWKSGHHSRASAGDGGLDDLKSCLIPPPSLPQLWRDLLGVRTVWSWWGVERRRAGRGVGVSDDRGEGTQLATPEKWICAVRKAALRPLSNSVLAPFSSSCTVLPHLLLHST